MTPQKREQKNKMFHYFQMEELVPQDHILRQIDKLVDFSFVRNAAKDCYCPDNGRPGVDPELVSIAFSCVSPLEPPVYFNMIRTPKSVNNANISYKSEVKKA